MPTQSPFPPIDIPNVDIWTLLLEHRDRTFPDDKVIFQDAETLRSYTYAQVKAAAAEFGKGLKAIWNWQKGEVLAIFSLNSIDTPVVTWGTHWAGGVVSPANPTFTADELAFQLKDTESRILATQLAFLPVAKEAAKKAGIPRDHIILIGDELDPTLQVKHFTFVRNISAVTRYRKTVMNPEKDLAFLVYSSGTTGMPKGVMLSHRNIVANVLQGTAGEGGNLSWTGGRDGKGDKILAFLPFFHIYGLTLLVHNSMYSGLQLVVMAKFNFERWCAHVQSFGITFSYIVPPIVLLLAKHPVVGKYDFSSLRMLHSGGAPLSRELVEATHTRIKIGIKQGYGLSEASPTTHTQSWSNWSNAPGSVGQMLPNLEAKYMTTPEDDSASQEVLVGQVGELYMRGPNIFLGYLNDPAATADCLSSDGWLRTGDVGYQDADGNFFITDRAKELIKYKGFQVAPAELEGLLTDNDAIEDVAVVGVESKEHGTEVPRAYVVPKRKVTPANSREEGKKITQWLNGKVAPHKRLRGGVRFVEEIPRSASGKILRRFLKERAKEEGVKAKL